jgi:putative transposase
MARKKKAAEPLGTVWRADDGLWSRVKPVLAELDPAHRGHRPRVDQRKALDGIIYHLRTGCQWSALPREFGDDSSVHRTMQRCAARGVFDRLWATLVEACDELGAVEWPWQSFDCVMNKARHGGIKSGRTRPTGRRTARSAAC